MGFGYAEAQEVIGSNLIFLPSSFSMNENSHPLHLVFRQYCLPTAYRQRSYLTADFAMENKGRDLTILCICPQNIHYKLAFRDLKKIAY